MRPRAGPSDVWNAYGDLATGPRSAELLTVSARLMAEGHPEGSVMHAVALLLQERYGDALEFVRSLDPAVEGGWPELVAVIAEDHLGLATHARLARNETRSWLRFLGGP